MRTLRAGSFRELRGDAYDAPKEIWGFRTAARRGGPVATAREFLRAHGDLFQLAGLRLSPPRVVRAAASNHVIFQQLYAGFRVHRAYVTVHLDRGNRVYFAKNRAVPLDQLPPAAGRLLSGAAAGRNVLAFLAEDATAPRVRKRERLWYWFDEALVPAWRVRVEQDRPRREWIAHVDARDGELLELAENLALAPRRFGRRGRGLVFDPNPVVTLDGTEALVGADGRFLRPPAEAYREVRLYGLDESGWLDGKRVTTRPTARRIHRPDGDFRVRAEQRGFEEVMAYHHVDTALRYFESLGYRGARAIFRRPVPIDVRATAENSSWYSPDQKSLSFGTGSVDDAEDGETILHELGHAVQDAICPDFGRSPQAAAMGEGFGDYLAASTFLDRKPARFRAVIASWDGLPWNGAGPVPGLRRVDHDWTADDFDEDGEEHENGEIWSGVLWDVLRALGRERADRVILESHFQLDGFTTFARGGRALVDADDNLFGGAHRRALLRVLRARRVFASRDEEP